MASVHQAEQAALGLEGGPKLRPPRQAERRVNVSDAERKVSVAAGSILAALGIYRRSIPGAVIAAVGAAMIHRGVTGRCYAYDALGLDTAGPEEKERAKRGIRVG